MYLFIVPYGNAFLYSLLFPFAAIEVIYNYSMYHRILLNFNVLLKGVTMTVGINRIAPHSDLSTG